MTPPALVDARTLGRVQSASARLGGAAAPAQRSGRVDAAELYDAWEHAYAQHGERVVQSVAQNLGLDDLGVFGFMARTAQDTRSAMEAALRFYPLISNDRSWALENRGDSVVLHLLSPMERRLGRRVSDEASIGQFLTCVASASRGRVEVREITLSKRALAPATLRRFCRRAPSRSRGCAIIFERASLDAPTTHAHRGMHSHFVSLAEAELRRLRPSWAAQTEHAMRHALAAQNGQSPIDHAIRTLGLSRRTLQRRLREESTTLQEVHDHIRYDIAQGMLREGATVESTALAVGFAETRAFTRAFVRWSGRTPSAFRESGH